MTVADEIVFRHDFTHLRVANAKHSIIAVAREAVRYMSPNSLSYQSALQFTFSKKDASLTTQKRATEAKRKENGRNLNNQKSRGETTKLKKS